MSTTIKTTQQWQAKAQVYYVGPEWVVRMDHPSDRAEGAYWPSWSGLFSTYGYRSQSEAEAAAVEVATSLGASEVHLWTLNPIGPDKCYRTVIIGATA